VTLNRMLSQNEPSDSTLKRVCDILHRPFAFQRVSVFCALSQQTLSLRAQAGNRLTWTPLPNACGSVRKITSCVMRYSIMSTSNIRSSSDWRGQSWEHWFSVFPDAKSFVLPQ